MSCRMNTLLLTGCEKFLSKRRLYMVHGYNRKVERDIFLSVLVFNVSCKPITLTKGTRVGTVEYYRGSVYALRKEDLLRLQGELKPELGPEPELGTLDQQMKNASPGSQAASLWTCTHPRHPM